MSSFSSFYIVMVRPPSTGSWAKLQVAKLCAKLRAKQTKRFEFDYNESK